jgi:hypothetical protein
MRGTKTYPDVHAVHHAGVLELLDALELPEGAQVRLSIRSVTSGTDNGVPDTRLVYPTRLVPADRLDKLTDLLEVGGDALVDSEALYDPDWN